MTPRLPLRFPADESCNFAVVRALRANGYDVLAVSESVQRSVDRELIERAHRQSRILLTEDKDFGRLVYVSHADSAGVILVRFPGDARRILAETVTRLVRQEGARLARAFVVVQPGQLRISRATDVAEAG